MNHKKFKVSWNKRLLCTVRYRFAWKWTRILSIAHSSGLSDRSNSIMNNHLHILKGLKGHYPGSEWLYTTLFEHENDVGKCLKVEISNNSMNLWSETLAFAAANLWYSSKIEVRHHFCNLLKHPTRQPVRCCTKSKRKTIVLLEDGTQHFGWENANKLKRIEYLPSFAMNQERVIPYILQTQASKSITKLLNKQILSCGVILSTKKKERKKLYVEGVMIYQGLLVMLHELRAPEFSHNVPVVQHPFANMLQLQATWVKTSTESNYN